MRSLRLFPALAAGSLIALSACERSVVAPDAKRPAPAAGGDSSFKPSARFFYTALTSGLLLTPIGLDFGDVQLGTTAPLQFVTITNIASLPVTMAGSGGAPLHAEFGAAQSCQGLMLAPDGSCTMQFNFTPTSAGLLVLLATGLGALEIVRRRRKRVGL